MTSIKEFYGDNTQLYDSIIKKVNFNLRCCIPGIIQSYNKETNTAEIQPAIREEIVNEDNSVSYMNLPLLINVPILFPKCSNGGITFPLSQNDEVLVFFSDLSYDNFWLYGNVQNPIEVRRHDLSDGLAIPTVISKKNTQANSDNLNIKFGDTKISMSKSEITFSSDYGEVTLSQIINLLHHKHRDADNRDTSTPIYI